MRELGINPVFPPREDLQVGDLYVYPLQPGTEEEYLKKNDYLPLGVWIASMDLNDELSEFYHGRNSFPVTADDGAESADPNANIYQSGDVHRLRLVGFPMFMSVTFTQGDLSALVPVEALSVALGVSFSSSTSVNVKVPNAESYALPAHLMVKRLLTEDGTFGISADQGLHGLTEELLLGYTWTSRSQNQAKLKVEGHLILITEVFYARTLDISVQSQQAVGATLAARPIVDSPGADAFQPGDVDASEDESGAATVDDEAEEDGQGGNSDPATPAELNPTALAATLNEQLDEAEAQNATGGSVRFVSVGTRSISMRATYPRPIAIGYRGVFLRVTSERDSVDESFTTVVHLSGPIDTAVASAARPADDGDGASEDAPDPDLDGSSGQ